MFSKVDRYPGDPILTLVETFQADPRPHKVNLGIGLYYDADGRIPLLDLVRRTEVGIAAEGRRRSYLPMEGHGPYREAARRLIFGVDSQAVRDGRIATIQTLGGSGALKVGADFLKRYFPDSGVWVSDPIPHGTTTGQYLKVPDSRWLITPTTTLTAAQFDSVNFLKQSLLCPSIVLFFCIPVAITLPESTCHEHSGKR